MDTLTALGRLGDAIESLMDILQRHPAEWPALDRLGILLVETGHTSAARLVFEEQLRQQPTDPWAHTRLAHLLQDAGELEAARAEYLAALRLCPGLGAAHEGLAVLLGDLGADPEAEAHRGAAFERAPVQALPYRGAEPPLPVLVLASARGGNMRYRSLLQSGPFAMTVLAVEFWDPHKRLPPHAVVVNAIGDRDRAGPALERAELLLKQTSAPVVNPPGAVVGRAAVAARARCMDGVRAPRMLEVVRDRVLMGHASAVGEELAAAGIRPPFLLRTPGFHTGRHLVRVETPQGLERAISQLPGPVLSAIEFLDTRSWDGLYRKFRVMAVGGSLLPGHMAASEHWMVHYRTSLTPVRDDLQREELSFLIDMQRVLPPAGPGVLRHLSDALQLDYAGFDFALSPDGEIVLFEANPVMVVLDPHEDTVHVGERRSAQRAVCEGFQRVVLAAAGVSPVH